MIDLRSDTLTVPTPEMRSYMSMAPVGDDVFGEDPTVNELQEYAAGLLGKEAALYVSSGVMGNQLAIAVNTNQGDEVIVEAESHIFVYETAAPSIISRVQLKCIASEKGMMEIDEIRNAIRPGDYYFPKTSLICLENTHNRHSGAVIDLDYIKAVGKLARDNSLKFHCDGARLWNACVARGISPAEYAEPFDTISVCLSKGLGAPVGSILAGGKKQIEAARKWRKILGGGMRQAGIIAAGGLYALRNNFDKLTETHHISRMFAEKLHDSGLVALDLNKSETNIVIFTLPEKINAYEFEDKCKSRGLLIIPFGKDMVRAVFHYQIDEKDATDAADIILGILSNYN